ncbi:hypothetical protein TMS3_0106435 [Pseudomonas taeanensis MS-3]|jgi:hypothetical protein|uniref:Uncharacterized protein n=1 Tax=Pseudomonas taeanensis MS-3 TaxID=1395571 RepID=A0A0A1YR91_9PSED|nr:hypothetical protein [Pseudomonas taeanensis]KFX71559.1 hypothetical protein TMS3_0106435 [Pseudomonas taeanensis MS-3]
MSLFDRLFKKASPSFRKENGETKTSGELIAEVTNGANLVDGKQTWEHAETHKDDVEYMKRCCDAELKTMAAAGTVAVPFYFERVAILSRKQKNFRQEVEYCERYIQAVKEFYRMWGHDGHADVRKGPRYKAIAERLPKAKELLAANQ